MGKHRVNRDQLKGSWAFLTKFIQSKHENPKDLLEEYLKVSNPIVKGLTHTRRFFALEPSMNLYLQYEMEHIVMDPELQTIGRSLRWVIIYDEYSEYEAERVKTLVGPGAEGVNFN